MAAVNVHLRRREVYTKIEKVFAEVQGLLDKLFASLSKSLRESNQKLQQSSVIQFLL
jgi:hypothetical protein